MTTGMHEGTVGKQETEHITKDLFCDWQAGRMKPLQEEQFLGHIGICTYCAGRFGDWMDERLMMSEEGLKEEPNGRLPSQSAKEEPNGQLPSQSAKEAPNGQLLSQSARLSEPPAYLKEEILLRTRQMDVQAAVYVKETSRRMQLILYSLKVGVAVMTSIFLMMVTANVQNMEFVPEQTAQVQEREKPQAEPGITDTLRQKSGEISNLLNSLSNGLFRLDTEETDQAEIRR